MWSSSEKASNLTGSTEQQPDVDPQQTTSRLHSAEDASSPQDVSIDLEANTPLLTEKEMLSHVGEQEHDVVPQQTTSRLKLDTEDTTECN